MEKEDRTSPSFTDPAAMGHKKISTTSWVAETLAATRFALEMNIENEETVDVNYELSDVT